MAETSEKMADMFGGGAPKGKGKEAAKDMPMSNMMGDTMEKGAVEDFSQYRDEVTAMNHEDLVNALLEVAQAYMTVDEWEAMLDEYGGSALPAEDDVPPADDMGLAGE